VTKIKGIQKLVMDGEQAARLIQRCYLCVWVCVREKKTKELVVDVDDQATRLIQQCYLCMCVCVSRKSKYFL